MHHRRHPGRLVGVANPPLPGSVELDILLIREADPPARISRRFPAEPWATLPDIDRPGNQPTIPEAKKVKR